MRSVSPNIPLCYAGRVNSKRNMPNMAFSTGKPLGHGSTMIDARGYVVHEGDEVFLLYSMLKKARYVIDEIDGHIAYLRPRTDSRVQPFPVLSDQIMKVKRSQVQA